jgi:hypothetical protein
MQASEQAPIACTLSLADMGPRLARIGQLTHEHLRSHRLEATTLRLTYDAAAADEVARIVELERQCCAFLDFRLTTRVDAIELVIVGPPQAGTDARWLFSQFLPVKGQPAPATVCACCAS